MTGRPFRLLIIQFTRLGDTVQSLMALRAAKQLYPELEMTVMVRDSFSAAVDRVEWIDHVIRVPTHLFLDGWSSGNAVPVENIDRVEDWVLANTQYEWDLLLNWSYSETSSFLAELFPAKLKLGYQRRGDLSLASMDGWSHYIQAVIQGEIPQNIHLTDIFTTQLLTALQIHLGEPEPAGDSAVTSKDFFELEISSEDLSFITRRSHERWVGIQMGASQREKCISPRTWAIVAQRILSRHSDTRILLFGGKGEALLEEEFWNEFNRIASPALRRRASSFVARASFDLWVALIAKCQWILSGDTAASHIGCVVGTRVFNVSVGPVRYEQTGPYGNGHYIIRSKHTEHAPDPDAIFGAWSYAALEWSHGHRMTLEEHFEIAGLDALYGQIEVRRSSIRATEDGGGVVYQVLGDTPIEVQEWVGLVIAQLARAWYCGWRPKTGQGVVPGRVTQELKDEIRSFREPLNTLKNVLAKGVELSERMAGFSKRFKSDRVMSLAQQEGLQFLNEQLQEIDLMIVRLGELTPVTRAFAQLSQVLMHNLNGVRIWELSEESSISYRQLKDGVEIVIEWLEYTLSVGETVQERTGELIPFMREL